MIVEGISRINAPAKLNLNLRVTGRRDDGYHLLDSVVVFTGFGDRIELEPAQEDSVAVTGEFASSVGIGVENICFRALAAFRDYGGVAGCHSINIDKRIPVGAGLGGGSSDAAVILLYLNRRSPAPLTDTRLAEAALSLGADVPVCLAGIAQRMQGIGDILTPVDPVPHGHLVLAKTDVMLPTGEVFQSLRESGFKEAAPLRSSEISGSVPDIIAAGNNLQAAAMSLSPDVARVIGRLRDSNGVIAAQMSGSGAACFGLFNNGDDAAAAAENLAQDGVWAVATRF
ncbi:MAG: 4-(cytidine 5'-diphospho)-2-C-methyl-D-erythritol kinase [Pseudomonadota bacterium]|nr:4-(cytidine 5'-diphospho)-2-C-methyl-D-erythritol kinase [Pseudomonadota bacterium]